MNGESGGWRSDEEGQATGIISEDIPTKNTNHQEGENGDMTKQKPDRHPNDQVSKVTIDSDGTSQYHVPHVPPDVMH